MIDWLSGKTLGWLIKTGSIEQSDSEVYLFGIHQGIMSILNIITTLLIAACFKMIPEGMMFIAVYRPLRSCVGGYHARTELRCYLYSAILSTTVFWISSWLVVNPVTLSCLAGAILVFWFVPSVEDTNKPVDETERRVYKSRCKRTIVLEMIAFAILCILQLDRFMELMIVTYMALCIILFLGMFRNYCVRRNFEGNETDRE